MSPSVLVIDDSRTDRFFMKRVLDRTEGLGPIDYCRDADEALVWLRAHAAPDIMFVDINMPRMNGFELLEAIQAEFADWPSGCHIAVLSSSGWREDRKRASRIPIIAQYFTKPLTAEVLQQWLAALYP